MELLIRGGGIGIDEEQCECLGAQLADLIEAIKADIPDVVWFAAHIDTVTGVPHWYSGEFDFVEIGTTETMIALSRPVIQYLSGVFIALRPEDVQSINGLQADTEETCPYFLEQSVLEIRAFDQAFFLISAHDPALAAHLL